MSAPKTHVDEEKGSFAHQENYQSEGYSNNDDGVPSGVLTDARGNALIEIDQRASNRLAYKMDLHIIPLVALQYLFAFIDRANIGNARLAGLERDLGLTGYDYNTLLSAFYISYIVFEIPANMFTKWFRPGRAIPLYTLTFGILSIGCAFIKTLGQGIAVRFLLGIAEAGMLPGIAYYLSRWYTKDELAFRLAMYIVCAPLAGGFGGLLASAILKIDSIGSVERWQMIFLVEGIITVGIGIISYFFMTDRPETARWLSEEEKVLAAARIKRETVGATVVLDKINKRAMLQGIFAPSTVVIAFIFLLNNITVQGIAFFTPTIVRSLYPQYTTIKQQTVTSYPYWSGAFFTVLVPYLSMKFKKRGLFMLISAPVMVAGYVMFLASNNPNVKFGGTFLITAGAFSFGALCNAWTSMNVASDTARASAIGTVVMFGNVGGLISTWTALPRDAPKYNILNGLNAATGSTIFFLTLGLLIWMRRDNAKREAGKYDYRLEGLTLEESNVLGNAHPGFRYKY